MTMTKVKMKKNRDEANVGGMQYFYDKVYRSYAAMKWIQARCADARKPPWSLKRVVLCVVGEGGGELRRKRARNLRYIPRVSGIS